MFTFLNSLILPALFAALIPLLIHLFNKQKTKKIKFSSLRFLKKLEKRRLKKVKIYQILLIIIRTLLIVFLVFAFARPTFSGAWNFLTEPSANTTAVVVLDDGLSMRHYDTGGNRFKRALVKLKQVLECFKIGDRIQISRTTNSNINLSDSANIDLQVCSYLIGDINTSLIKAAEYFKENVNVNNELHIISDLNMNKETIRSFAENNQSIKIYLENIKSPGSGNISIEKIEFENTLFEINKQITVKAHLKNHNAEKAMNTGIHLFINDKRMAQNNSNLAFGERKIVPLNFTAKDNGWNIGYIEIDDDDLLADNRYYFSIRIPKKARVLFVDNQVSSYLKYAFEAINTNANIDVEIENYNRLARQSFNEYNVIFLGNLPELPDVIVSRLKSFIESGGGLIIIPGEKTIPSYFNTSLSDMFGGLKILNLNKIENPDNYFILKDLEQNNPILVDLFRKENPEISLPKFKKYFRLTNTQQFQTLMKFNDNYPFLLHAENNHLKAFVLSSYFDDDWTDLQYKGIFVPMLIKMIKYLAFAMDINKNGVFVGNDCFIRTKRGFDNIVYDLLSPAGDKSRIMPIFSGSDIAFELQDLNIPGNYEIKQGSEILSVISVNVDAEKLLAEQSSPDELVVDVDNVEIIDENENINQKVKEARFGEEIWKYFIALALLILLLESFVVKKIEGKI